MSGEALAIQSLQGLAAELCFRLHTILSDSRGFNGAFLSGHHAEVVQPNQTLTTRKIGK